MLEAIKPAGGALAAGRDTVKHLMGIDAAVMADLQGGGKFETN